MYDEGSGFYYLRSRYYDPYIGRFLIADELIQSDYNEASLFIYGKSNPIKYGDSGWTYRFINRGRWRAVVAFLLGIFF